MFIIIIKFNMCIHFTYGNNNNINDLLHYSIIIIKFITNFLRECAIMHVFYCLNFTTIIGITLHAIMIICYVLHIHSCS